MARIIRHPEAVALAQAEIDFHALMRPSLRGVIVSHIIDLERDFSAKIVFAGVGGAGIEVSGKIAVDLCRFKDE